VKTIVHSSIDGFDILLGFSDPVTDPVATSIKIGPLVQSFPEMKQVAAIKQQISDAEQRAFSASQQMQAATRIRNQAQYAAAQPLWAKAQSDIESLRAQLLPLTSTIETKRRALWVSNAVYCNPGSSTGTDGSVVYESLMPETDAEYNDGKTGHITATVLKAAFDAQAKNQATKIDGTYVPDYRGITFWSLSGSTWSKRSVTSLDDSPASGEIAEAYLTDAQQAQIGMQLEAVRVAKLTKAQKLAEAQSQQASAKSAVVSVQTEVTAGISTQAELDAALTTYHDQLSAINTKYGTSLT